MMVLGCCLDGDVGLLVCRMLMNFDLIDLLVGVVADPDIADLGIGYRC